MRVLVLEDEHRASADAMADLSSAGHEVVRCYGDDAPPFPCAGMPGGNGCPLEHSGVDVALAVRQSASPPTHAEDGVRCALRRHVPLVVAGATGRAPWVGMATVVEPDLRQVLAAVEHAATVPLRRHSEAATSALREAMDRSGLDPTGSDVEVRRLVGGIQARLRPALPLPPKLAHAAGVRVAAALRHLDDKSTGVDVVLDEPAGV